MMPNTSSKKMIGFALDIAGDPQRAAALRLRKQGQASWERQGLLDGPEHVIIGGRQEGKTTLALKWLQDCPTGLKRVLVVNHNDVARSLRAQCGFSQTDDRIISFRSLLKRGASRNPRVEYGIDETADILRALLGLQNIPHMVTVAHAEEWQYTAYQEPLMSEQHREAAVVAAAIGGRVLILTESAGAIRTMVKDMEVTCEELQATEQLRRISLVNGKAEIEFVSGGRINFGSLTRAIRAGDRYDQIFAPLPMPGQLQDELQAALSPNQDSQLSLY